jgi:hypothetical protein
MRLQLISPINTNKIYSSDNHKELLKKCYAELKESGNPNIDSFTVMDPDTLETYKYQINKKKNMTGGSDKINKLESLFYKLTSKVDLINKNVKILCDVVSKNNPVNFNNNRQSLSPKKSLSPRQSLSLKKSLSPRQSLSPRKSLSPRQSLSPRKSLSPRQNLSPKSDNNNVKSVCVSDKTGEKNSIPPPPFREKNSNEISYKDENNRNIPSEKPFRRSYNKDVFKINKQRLDRLDGIPMK